VGLPKYEVSIKPVVSQSLYASLINKIMFVEQIFQNINKQMLEMTYILKLGQLLKTTPYLKKYMWQKLKQKKPNIATKQMSKPNVTTMVETHYELDTIVIEVDNQMAIIQVQVGNNII
jgi:hypothetical protein